MEARGGEGRGGEARGEEGSGVEWSRVGGKGVEGRGVGGKERDSHTARHALLQLTGYFNEVFYELGSNV